MSFGRKVRCGGWLKENEFDREGSGALANRCCCGGLTPVRIGQCTTTRTGRKGRPTIMLTDMIMATGIVTAWAVIPTSRFPLRA